MLLIDLEMINFRPYLRPHKIAFATGRDRNVTLIHGMNGAGKTSLLTALNWVLYGKSAVIDELADNPLVNKEVAKTGTKVQPARAVVHLRFSHDGKIYKLTRSATAYREGERIVHADAKVSLWVTLHNGNTESVPEPDVEIRKILPFAIRTFYLFDAEKISDFTAPGKDNNEKIVKAVNDVLQIKPLRSGVLHLAQLKSAYLKKMQAIPAPKTQETKNLLSLVQIEQKRLIGERADIIEESAAKRERIEVLDTRLESFVEIQAEAEERRRVLGQIETAKIASVQLRRELASLVMRYVGFPVRDRIASSINILGSFRSEHKIPARIQDYFIRELLHERKCICGRPISDGSHEDRLLREILASLLPGSLQDQASDLLTFLKPMLSEIKTAETDLVGKIAAIEKNALLSDRLYARLEELGGAIDEKAAAEAKVAIEERKGLLRDVSALERKIVDIRARIVRNEGLETQYQKVLEEALATKEKVSELASASAFFRELHDELEAVEKELELQIRDALGRDASEILHAIAGRPFFEKVLVGTEFILRIQDSKGDDIRNQLSNGQKQISALAFMMAMTQLGGHEAPIVIDTPLARLDETVRVQLVGRLPRLTSQVVFLMTDTEFAGGVIEALRPFIGSEYRLDYKNEETTVSEVPL